MPKIIPKFTPGNWTFEYGQILDENRNVVAVKRAMVHADKREGPPFGTGISPHESDCNGRLMAASPKLFKACVKFIDSFKSLQREKCDVALILAKEAVEEALKEPS